MNKYYLGIDIGSVLVKGVIIDNNDTIISSKYLYIEKDSIKTTKELISILNKKIRKLGYDIESIGVTGVGRKLIGTILGVNAIRNEIESHTIGITSIKSDIKTIIDIGKDNIKIIELNNGNIINYNIYDVYILDCNNKNAIVNRICDILIDIYNNKKIMGLVSLQGGFSKNIDIIKTLKKIAKGNIYIDKNSLYLGSLGIAIISKINNFEVLNGQEVI